VADYDSIVYSNSVIRLRSAGLDEIIVFSSDYLIFIGSSYLDSSLLNITDSPANFDLNVIFLLIALSFFKIEFGLNSYRIGGLF